MRAQLPLTIEILGLKDGEAVVVERVIGATLYLEEAKRIGQHLLSIADVETPPMGYRILSHSHDLVYDCEVGRDEQSNQHSAQ
jgi:hypothetical protein